MQHHKEFHYHVLVPILLVLIFLPDAVRGQPNMDVEWKPELTEVWEPVPPIVTPGDRMNPPSDAVILFDGKNLDQWKSNDGGEAGWDVSGCIMTVTAGAGDIHTTRSFGDVQLHIEWRTPAEVEGEGQGRGNSGVFLQDQYEIQILDSFDNATYSNGQAGALYKQHIPLVNASRGPGEWQTYDIMFLAPVFSEDGKLVRAAFVTLIHNGVLIQNHVELRGPTLYIWLPTFTAHGRLPIRLQDHGNPTSFRNIWVREI